MRTAIASILAAFALVVLAVLPASAKVSHPNVWIVHEHGTFTTPCVVHAGEVLRGAGLAGPPDGGNYTILSVRPDGPVDLVTLSPSPKITWVLDFYSQTGQ